MAEVTQTNSECSEMLSTACAEVPMALQAVLDRIHRASEAGAAASRHQGTAARSPRLVAVSKTKPFELVLAAYHAGQRHFGESYVKEFVEKSNMERVVAEAPGVQWHFIGHLQTNKCKQLLGARNLWIVETVCSDRLATALDSACTKCNRQEPLRVLVQINSSLEENKHGCLPADCTSLVRHIMQSCTSLKFCGLMTIGAVSNSLQETASANPDFRCLLECRDELCRELSINPGDLDLSMGMTNDLESAIQHGSTNVRIGTAIFGAREYGSKQ